MNRFSDFRTALLKGIVMTHVADEAKQNKFFRFLHGVSERALRGSLDISQFISVAQVLLDKNTRTVNLLEFIAKGCPRVDYAEPIPKIRRQKPLPLVVDLDAVPFIPEGWSVESHQPGGQFVFDAVQLKLHFDVDQQNSKYVKGTELRTKLKNVPVMNANMLDWYLAHPDRIPEDWKGKAVFFWGTVYRDQDGDSSVRFMFWDVGRWRWFAYWLDSHWSGGCPALVRAGT